MTIYIMSWNINDDDEIERGLDLAEPRGMLFSSHDAAFKNANDEIMGIWGDQIDHMEERKTAVHGQRIFDYYGNVDGDVFARIVIVECEVDG